MKLSDLFLKAVNYSPIRYFEYTHINKTHLKGKVLDLGGGAVSSYTNFFKGEFEIISMNISRETNPTIVGDITKEFPFMDEEFDFIISMNTFEHIPEFYKTLSESVRVLKKEGELIFSVPFLHQVHGSPDDYWRLTSSAWKNVLNQSGFKIKHILPLGTGIFMARYSLIYGAIPKIFRPLAVIWALLLDTVFCKISIRFRKICGPQNYPLGYWIVATK